MKAPDARAWKELEARKSANVGQVLLKCARLLDERAIARVNRAGARPRLRPSHTRLLAHVDVTGTRLSVLAGRIGISKQAVGQLVDDLGEQGVLEVVADPRDGRARLVRFTARGVEAIAHGLGVLAQIEAEVTAKIGPRKMRALHATLLEVLAALEAPDPAGAAR